MGGGITARREPAVTQNRTGREGRRDAGAVVAAAASRSGQTCAEVGADRGCDGCVQSDQSGADVRLRRQRHRQLRLAARLLSCQALACFTDTRSLPLELKMPWIQRK